MTKSTGRWAISQTDFSNLAKRERENFEEIKVYRNLGSMTRGMHDKKWSRFCDALKDCRSVKNLQLELRGDSYEFDKIFSYEKTLLSLGEALVFCRSLTTIELTGSFSTRTSEQLEKLAKALVQSPSLERIVFPLAFTNFSAGYSITSATEEARHTEAARKTTNAFLRIISRKGIRVSFGFGAPPGLVSESSPNVNLSGNQASFFSSQSQDTMDDTWREAVKKREKEEQESRYWQEKDEARAKIRDLERKVQTNDKPEKEWKYQHNLDNAEANFNSTYEESSHAYDNTTCTIC